MSCSGLVEDSLTSCSRLLYAAQCIRAQHILKGFIAADVECSIFKSRPAVSSAPYDGFDVAEFTKERDRDGIVMPKNHEIHN